MSAPTAVWTKVTAVLPQTPEDWSIWAEEFALHGLPGTVQTDDPPTLSAYLSPGDLDRLPGLARALTERGALKVETEDVPEIDWAEAWKQFFKPTRIGQRFVVRPTWEEASLETGDIEIVLDPGQAFGTGDHPTTRMCLELLEGQELAGQRVADIGCGSGILSIAAMKRGAASVTAVDTESESVETCEENAQRNQVVVNARQGSGFAPLQDGDTFDLVLSNIISAALIALAPEASRRVKSGGHWIVSGIIAENWGDVRAKAESVGFTLVKQQQEGEWVAATFAR